MVLSAVSQCGGSDQLAVGLVLVFLLRTGSSVIPAGPEPRLTLALQPMLPLVED